MDPLLELIIKTIEYWNLPSKTLFHHAISQFLTQKIRFETSRKIRKGLYEILGDPYDANKLEKITPVERNRLCLTEKQLLTMYEIKKACLDDDPITKLSGIPGIGSWTIDSIKLMMNLDPDISLLSDSWIRSRISEYTSTDPYIFMDQYKGNRSIVSKFFWRIKPSGVIKLKRKVELIRDDFV